MPKLLTLYESITYRASARMPECLLASMPATANARMPIPFMDWHLAEAGEKREKKYLIFHNLLGYCFRMTKKIKFCECPNCGKSFNIFSVIKTMSSPQRISASKKNGLLGGRPKKWKIEDIQKIAGESPLDWITLSTKMLSAGISRRTFFRIKNGK